jgi:hypothetical protein
VRFAGYAYACAHRDRAACLKPLVLDGENDLARLDAAQLIPADRVIECAVYRAGQESTTPRPALTPHWF